MPRQQQKRTPTPAAGFFGGIESGRESTALRAEAEMQAQEKLRSAMLAAQKRDDTVLSGVRSEIMDIQTSMQDATPEDIQGLIHRKNYLIKTVAPEMLPDEWFSQGNEGFEPSAEASAESGVGVGSLVPQEYNVGDPKAGAERLKKGGLRRVTKSEMVDFNMAKGGRIVEDTHGYKRGTPVFKVMGYGSQVAMNKDMFMKEAYGTAVRILTANGQRSIGDGMGDGETWDRVRAGIYMDADNNRIDPDVAKKLVDRFENSRKENAAGLKSQVDMENAVIRTVGNKIKDWFGAEIGIDGQLLRITKGSQDLYLALEKRMYDEVASGNRSSSAILAGIHTAAESWAIAHPKRRKMFAPVALRTSDIIRTPLESHPKHAKRFEAIAPSSIYDDLRDIMYIIDTETGEQIPLYGEDEINEAYRIAMNGIRALDLAESLVGLESIGKAMTLEAERNKPKAGKLEGRVYGRVNEVGSGFKSTVEAGLGIQQYDANGDPIPRGEAMNSGLLKMLMGEGNY